MSMSDYETAKSKISKYLEQASFYGQQPDSLIFAAQERLKVKFPPTYFRFLQEYGAGGIGSFEIYGLTGKEFDTAERPDVVWYTEKVRTLLEFPEDLIPVYELGDGEFFCLDLSKNTEEAFVVAYTPGYDYTGQSFEKLAEDFGALLLLLIEQEENRN